MSSIFLIIVSSLVQSVDHAILIEFAHEMLSLSKVTKLELSEKRIYKQQKWYLCNWSSDILLKNRIEN